MNEQLRSDSDSQKESEIRRGYFNKKSRIISFSRWTVYNTVLKIPSCVRYVIEPCRWSDLVDDVHSESVVSMENVWNEGNLLLISQSRPRDGSWRLCTRWYTVRIFAIFVAVTITTPFVRSVSPPFFSFSLETTVTNTLVFHEQHVVKSHTRHLSRQSDSLASLFVSAWEKLFHSPIVTRILCTSFVIRINFYSHRWTFCWKGLSFVSKILFGTSIWNIAIFVPFILLFNDLIILFSYKFKKYISYKSSMIYKVSVAKWSLPADQYRNSCKVA